MRLVDLLKSFASSIKEDRDSQKCAQNHFSFSYNDTVQEDAVKRGEKQELLILTAINTFRHSLEDRNEEKLFVNCLDSN
jgi:hypothetical protein